MAADRIYLDHAASAPLSPRARAAMEAARAETGNPSSPHAEGRRAREVLEDARSRVAGVLGVRAREVVFTPSGTVACQLGLVGTARARRDVSRRVVLSGVEHPSVSDAGPVLEAEGFEITTVAPDADGHVDAESFLDAVGDDAAVCALMLANHETGVLNPVRDVAVVLRERGVPLLCDACLGPGRVPVTDDAVGADLAAFTAHKLGGPRGTGVLTVRRRTSVRPLWTGGLQEERLVPGTEDVVGAAGLAAALEEAVRSTPERAARYERLVDAFLAALDGARPWSRVGGRAAPGVLTLEIPGVEGEAAMINLDLEGVAVATGSTCALGAARPSATLRAMGWTERRIARTLRFSFGEGVDDTQVKVAAAVVGRVIERLRALARH